MTVALLALVCLAAGFAIRLLRRLPRLVFAGTLVAAAILIFIVIAAPAGPLSFFGRTLELDANARAFILPAVVIAAALAFFGPLTFERVTAVPAVIIANSQGAYFFGALASLVIAIAIDSFPLAVFFWAIGLIVLMFAAHPQTEGRVGGAAQFLLITVIASASLFLTNRLIDLYPLTPENSDLIKSTVIFFALGLGLLLAAFPFSLWLGPLADEIPLLAMAFLTSVAQPVGVWLLLQKISQVRWLVERSPLLTIVLWGGVLTAIVGALLVLVERREVRWLAFLSLIPLGHALVGLGLGTRLASMGAVMLLLNRALGITLLAGGLSLVRYHAERRWQRIGAWAIAGGGMVLAGLAPFPGLAAQMPIYRELAARHVLEMLLLLAANAVLLVATLRAAWQVWMPSASAKADNGEVKIVPYLCAAVMLLLVLGASLAGLFPQIIADWVVLILPAGG